VDLRKLTLHMSERKNQNAIFTYEKGQIVKRTHDAVYSDVMAACARLTSWGVRSGMRVGIWACNCYQWIIYDVALLQLRAVSVAFTDDFATMTADELIDKYSLSLLLVSASERAYKNGKYSAAIAFLDTENDAIEAVPGQWSQTDWEFENTGLVFSSGSSGRLKGLTLNRRGIEASVDAFTRVADPQPGDCLLLFLPISNFQQRLMYYSALWYGFDLIVTDPTRLFRALKDFSPTILIAPPMLYEAFETNFAKLPSWKQRLAKTIGGMARRLPAKSLRETIGRIIFRDAYKALGGRMRFMVTGMAPIKRSTLDLCALMQLPLFETYGMTEFGGIALNHPGANKLGSVGRPLPGVRVETAADGEIIAVREHRIASGYFECAEGEQDATFLSSNKVATGDIGWLDDEGYLYLTGRKKEMIITAGGTKIHPEIPESAIDACPDVARAVVFADADLSMLVAVVLPKTPDDEGAKVRIQQFVDKISKRQSSMMVGKIIFTNQGFSRENGFLRPNLKLDRKKIAQHFLAASAETREMVAGSAYGR
jgi:long-chain acyl-CoA synthetase